MVVWSHWFHIAPNTFTRGHILTVLLRTSVGEYVGLHASVIRKLIIKHYV